LDVLDHERTEQVDVEETSSQTSQSSDLSTALCEGELTIMKTDCLVNLEGAGNGRLRQEQSLRKQEREENQVRQTQSKVSI
jgi:hypothetical protein